MYNLPCWKTSVFFTTKKSKLICIWKRLYYLKLTKLAMHSILFHTSFLSVYFNRVYIHVKRILQRLTLKDTLGHGSLKQPLYNKTLAISQQSFSVESTFYATLSWNFSPVLDIQGFRFVYSIMSSITFKTPFKFFIRFDF